MHLGIIKITYYRTAMHFMDDRFVNLEEVILTFLWKSGTSDSATVCLVIRLSICYWLFKCRVLRVMCVWERETRSHNHGLCANTYELHHCVCHTTLFRSRAWTDGKTKDIINFFYFSFESWSSQLWKGELHFWYGLWCSANPGVSKLRPAGHLRPAIVPVGTRKRFKK